MRGAHHVDKHRSHPSQGTHGGGRPGAALTSVGLFQSSAIARTPKPPPYAGPATGTVTCDAPNIKVTFVPPLTVAGTGASTVTLKGTLKDCTTPPGSPDVITLGKITGSFTTSGGCLGLATGTTTPVNFTVQWKGKHNGGKATTEAGP